ncbi:MAG: SgcJ/EcaC family oxidoreductase [Pseudomonadota bacterium]
MSKLSVRMAAAVFVVATVFAIPVQAHHDEAHDQQAIREHGDRWIELYKAGDLDGLMALYEPDAIVTLHDQPGLFGRDAVRAYFSQSVGMSDVTFELDHEHIEVNGDIAHAMAKYWLTAVNKENGYVYKDAGRSLLIYRRGDDGQWRIHVDIDQTTPDVVWPESDAQ